MYGSTAQRQPECRPFNRGAVDFSDLTRTLSWMRFLPTGTVRLGFVPTGGPGPCGRTGVYHRLVTGPLDTRLPLFLLLSRTAMPTGIILIAPGI
jgi:hypothetical protein